MSLFPAAIACPEPACGEPVEPVERAAHYGKSQSSLASGESEKLTSLFTDRAKLGGLRVDEFTNAFVK